MCTCKNWHNIVIFIHMPKVKLNKPKIFFGVLNKLKGILLSNPLTRLLRIVLILKYLASDLERSDIPKQA